MNATTEIHKRLADYLVNVCDFCITRGQSTGRMFVGNTAAQIFRYIAFCHLSGRLNVRYDAHKITAILICWPDWQEHIEHKAARNKPQFDWTRVPRGNSMFVAEVIGSRRALRVLYEGLIELHPHLLQSRVFTMRHSKLVNLPQAAIERFMR